MRLSGRWARRASRAAARASEQATNELSRGVNCAPEQAQQARQQGAGLFCGAGVRQKRENSWLQLSWRRWGNSAARVPKQAERAGQRGDGGAGADGGCGVRAAGRPQAPRAGRHPGLAAAAAAAAPGRGVHVLGAVWLRLATSDHAWVLLLPPAGVVDVLEHLLVPAISSATDCTIGWRALCACHLAGAPATPLHCAPGPMAD